jgi:hypothetical protein
LSNFGQDLGVDFDWSFEMHRALRSGEIKLADDDFDYRNDRFSSTDLAYLRGWRGFLPHNEPLKPHSGNAVSQDLAL